MNDDRLKQACLLADKVLSGIKDWPVDPTKVHLINHRLGVMHDQMQLVELLLKVNRLEPVAPKASRAWAVLSPDGTPDVRNIWPACPSKWTRDFHQKNGYPICRIKLTCDPEDILEEPPRKTELMRCTSQKFEETQCSAIAPDECTWPECECPKKEAKEAGGFW